MAENCIIECPVIVKGDEWLEFYPSIDDTLAREIDAEHFAFIDDFMVGCDECSGPIEVVSDNVRFPRLRKFIGQSVNNKEVTLECPRIVSANNSVANTASDQSEFSIGTRVSFRKLRYL